jgi:hypothetical protein
MHYHISWLEAAIQKLKKSDEFVNGVNGEMTIEDFIEMFCKRDLDKVIKV